MLDRKNQQQGEFHHHQQDY